MHSVYDGQVGLSSPLLAEVEFFDCVIWTAWFCTVENCSNSPLPAHL